MGRYEPVTARDGTTVFPYNDLTPPSFEDICTAYQTVREHLPKPPLTRSESLSDAFEADVYLKRDDTLPTGSFKIRGAVTVIDQLSPEFREAGVVTYTMGNHGQGVAYACREFGVEAHIVVPETLDNPGKIKQMERRGARVIRHGHDIKAAREHAERLAAEHGYFYYFGSNDRQDIAGKGSLGLELMEDLPETDVVIAPIGGGTQAAAYSMTVGQLLDTRVIGVQSEGADAVYRAWNERHFDTGIDEIETDVEGISTKVPRALPLEIMWEHLDEMVLVSDDEIWDAVYEHLAEDHVLTEGAGAASRAGANKLQDELAGQTVVLQVSGGNIAMPRLQDVLERHAE